MKEIFDIKRFGKYFTFDLNNAWEKYGFTLLIMGFFPVIFYAVMTLIHLVFGGDVANEPTVYQVFPAFIFIFVCLGFGAKVYGSVTERRSGTDWIALPASALEKTLSLLLLTCIVLPACLLGLLFLSQAIVSLFVTDLPPLFSIIGDAVRTRSCAGARSLSLLFLIMNSAQRRTASTASSPFTGGTCASLTR